MSRVFRHVNGCVPDMTVVGPRKVFGGSDFSRVHSSTERSLLALDDTATIPTFPAPSTPTVANSGLSPGPEIFAVWLTTHAPGFEQYRSTQNATFSRSVPCGPHSPVQGPDVSAPCT